MSSIDCLICCYQGESELVEADVPCSGVAVVGLGGKVHDMNPAAVIVLRVIGAWIGYFTVFCIHQQTIFAPTTGENGIGQAMWFWGVGWMRIPIDYTIGIALGIWGLVPAVKLAIRGVAWMRGGIDESAQGS